MANTFFQATQDALDNITSAFDFVHPLRASMKYTRRIISEMNSANPDITEASFQAEVDPDTLTDLDTEGDRFKFCVNSKN